MPIRNDKPVFTCRECQSGLIGIRFVTYFTRLGDEMVMVPDFPAWVCDVCGYTIYDVKAVSLISTLLSPNTGKDAPKLKKRVAKKEDSVPKTIKKRQIQSQ